MLAHRRADALKTIPHRVWDVLSNIINDSFRLILRLHPKYSFSPLQEKEERYLMLFPNLLVMISASPRMSGFIYQVRLTRPPKSPIHCLWLSDAFCFQGRFPLTGAAVTRHAEDADTGHYAFDIAGLHGNLKAFSNLARLKIQTLFNCSTQIIQQ